MTKYMCYIRTKMDSQTVSSSIYHISIHMYSCKHSSIAGKFTARVCMYSSHQQIMWCPIIVKHWFDGMGISILLSLLRCENVNH